LGLGYRVWEEKSGVILNEVKEPASNNWQLKDENVKKGEEWNADDTDLAG